MPGPRDEVHLLEGIVFEWDAVKASEQTEA